MQVVNYSDFFRINNLNHWYDLQISNNVFQLLDLWDCYK